MNEDYINHQPISRPELPNLGAGHMFTHTGQGDIYCTRCGYVCYDATSTYERNNNRQRHIPPTCSGEQK